MSIIKKRLVKTAHIEIKGQVQGIGFRPYVYQLASALNIKGTIANTRAGVVIVAQGDNLQLFIHQLRTHPPPLSIITAFKTVYIKAPPFANFSIIKSTAEPSSQSVDVLPDLSICAECRQELFNPRDRRFLYPFINCTKCGPRYTIIEQIPYDRERTTMRLFNMCPECQKEYLDPLNRRFHAEPIACPVCGPQLYLVDNKGRHLPGNPLSEAANALIKGKILAIKGLGGFHLACDATNETAVKSLRLRKERSNKPLAIMVEDIKTAKLICKLPPGAAKILGSSACPIVLLPKKKKPLLEIAPLVAPNNPDLGVMLAYTPLHLLLFHTLRQLTKKPAVLVMTSANRSDEPIVSEEKELINNLRGVFDLALTHNRPIANRCDDAVVAMESSKPILVRRARGYAPQPLQLGRMFHVKQPTLALGGDGRNMFAVAAGERVFFSPHIGELDSARSEQFLLETLERLITWTGIIPKRVVCDLHPDYHSTRLAFKLAKRFGANVCQIQHHFAHLLAVMAEHNLSAPLLGVGCDGTGYGLDGAIWGCEFILIRKDLSWRRLGHLGYLRHNAGAGMVADPVKVALAYLSQCGLKERQINGLGLKGHPLPDNLPVLTSSLGRLFDAVAAITGICIRATFEGEAAIALENAALNARKSALRQNRLSNALISSPRGLIIDPKPILLRVFEMTLSGKNPNSIALWFHQALTFLLARAALELTKETGVKVVCLSGGSFQNRFLRRGLKRLLSKRNLLVYHNEKVPLNDGGIALGQVVVPD
ncbi:MAG: carbamoyltransferase HypF [candidate division WOR-3 bacterium]